MEFTRQRVEGNEIVHSTTNGTGAICLSQSSNPHQILVGAFCNLTTLANYLIKQNKDVQILCSGWNKMSLVNIAKAGIFSADRSINEYAENIWNLKKVK